MYRKKDKKEFDSTAAQKKMFNTCVKCPQTRLWRLPDSVGGGRSVFLRAADQAKCSLYKLQLEIDQVPDVPYSDPGFVDYYNKRNNLLFKKELLLRQVGYYGNHDSSDYAEIIPVAMVGR